MENRVAPPPAADVAERPYRTADDTDWWRVRDLLVRTLPLVPPGWNWDIRRWDGSRFHQPDGRLPRWFADGIRLWEAGGGTLVGAVHPDGGGDAWLELDPAYRDLEPRMLAWAEAHLAGPDGAGGRRLEVLAWDADDRRRAVLRDRGYVESGREAWLRWLRFDAWTPPALAPIAGYRLRPTSPETIDGDAIRMADLLNAAFRRTSHTPPEYLAFVHAAPCFRHDLNLVADAPDGAFAAHVGFAFDEHNRHGIIEPVCTHPDHRRRGLARALLVEGLRRLRALGAVTCTVETGGDPGANAFYRSLGFTEEHRGHAWRLALPGDGSR